jgi:hypothetical protein
MINPYFIYILSFSIAIAVYQLKWSSLYPDLGIELIFFLLVTFVGAFFAENIFKKKCVVRDQKISFNYSKSIKILLILYFSWTLDFIYGKGIPLLLALQGIQYELTDFAIPFFHVLLSTFNSFFSTYLFHSYLSLKTRENFRVYIISLIPFLLLFARGAFLMNIFSSIFVYLNFKKGLRKSALNIKILITIFVFLIPILFLFGLFGNIRTAAVYNRDDYEIILDIGKAVPEYRSSVVPKEFFWSYLYVSSPLANLQETINSSKSSIVLPDDIIKFIANELLPDFVSKRLNELFQFKKSAPILISDDLTVSTTYGSSFAYLSWVGLFLMASFLMIFPFLYIPRLLENNPFYLTALSITNTIYLFSMFDNMLVFSGLSFQLIYPILMSKILGVKFLEEKKDLIDNSSKK